MKHLVSLLKYFLNNVWLIIIFYSLKLSISSLQKSLSALVNVFSLFLFGYSKFRIHGKFFKTFRKSGLVAPMIIYLTVPDSTSFWINGKSGSYTVRYVL